MAKVSKRSVGATITRYGPEVVGLHWLFIITFIPLLWTGILLLRDWFIHEFHIYGVNKLVPVFDWIIDYHWYFGVMVLIVGLAHFLVHSRQKEKHILPQNVGWDLRASIHNILWIFHLVSREERGAAHKYKGNQRMTYVATVYVLSLAAITALIMYLDLLGELGTVMHVIAGVLVVFMAAYRILHIIRKHDGVAIRSILATGKVPEWWAKKHHYLWYRSEKGGYEPPKDPDYERLHSKMADETEVVKG
jgi:cytochrome b subunit of formate dehydrogenase